MPADDFQCYTLGLESSTEGLISEDPVIFLSFLQHRLIPEKRAL